MLAYQIVDYKDMFLQFCLAWCPRQFRLDPVVCEALHRVSAEVVYSLKYLSL